MIKWGSDHRITMIGKSITLPELDEIQSKEV
jgi:lipopolysaccharide/colanic/teichoic acid biosynthesis glycosyltransferase